MKDLAAIVLCAGASTRMGCDDKLLASLDGQPVISYVFATLAELELGHVIVVAGTNQMNLKPLVSRAGFELVANPVAGSGIGSSIAVGASNLSSPLKGTFICLGDMPLVTASTYRQVAEKFKVSECDKLCAVVPRYRMQQGHPVLFSRQQFENLQACSGDQGARHVLEAHSEQIETCPVNDPGCVFDIDTPQDLSAAARAS